MANKQVRDLVIEYCVSLCVSAFVCVCVFAFAWVGASESHAIIKGQIFLQVPHRNEQFLLLPELLPVSHHNYLEFWKQIQQQMKIPNLNSDGLFWAYCAIRSMCPFFGSSPAWPLMQTKYFIGVRNMVLTDTLLQSICCTKGNTSVGRDSDIGKVWDSDIGKVRGRIENGDTYLSAVGLGLLPVGLCRWLLCLSPPTGQGGRESTLMSEEACGSPSAHCAGTAFGSTLLDTGPETHGCQVEDTHISKHTHKCTLECMQVHKHTHKCTQKIHPRMQIKWNVIIKWNAYLQALNQQCSFAKKYLQKEEIIVTNN